MPKRQAGTSSMSEGAVGVIYPMVQAGDGKLRQHSAYGAKARFITNRYSGLLVELTTSHGPHKAGAQLQIAPGEFANS